MPNGQCYVPYRIPGMYTCYMCRDLKDAEEFYKDSSRYSGCSSRCMDCEGHRTRMRAEGNRTPYSAKPNKRTFIDNRWSKRQLKKRVAEINALWDPQAVEKAHEKVGMVRPWTDGEDGKLQKMLETNEPMEKIAKVLHRGKGAIRVRISIIGYPMHSNGQRRWTSEEDLEFEALVGQEVSDDDIAIRMNRSLSSVQQHRRKLKKEGGIV